MRRASLGIVAAAVLLVALGGPVGARSPVQDDDADASGVTIALEVGLDGHVSPQRSYPVVVDVTADRLVAGTLVVTTNTDFGLSGIEVPVEVAASTTKRFVVTAGSANGFGGGVVRVALRSDGRRVADAEQNLAIDQTDELVGVLPGLVAAIDRSTVPLAVDVGLARLGAIPPDVLGEGPLALAVFDQIASGPGDLDDLGPAELAALVAWVADGGHLLVDVPAGAELPLPAELRPAAGSTSASPGLGRVSLTSGALAAGRWDDTLLPTSTQSQVEEQMLSTGMGFVGDLTSSLARDAGFRLPEISTVVLVLGGYVLLVGPLAWLWCRRTGRPTLMWAIVPGIAVVTTVTLQLFGRDFRSSERAVHVTMVEAGPSGIGMATSSVFVSATSGQTALDLPSGWIPAINPMFGPGGPNGQSPLLRSGDGGTIVLDTDEGGASMVRSRGPFDLGGALVVTASADEDGKVHGTVENTLDIDLRDVAVFIGRGAVVKVGDVPAGEQADWALDEVTSFLPDAFPEAEVWPLDVDPRFFGGSFIGPNGEETPFLDPEEAGEQASSLSAFGDLMSSRGTNYRPPGKVIAVGWTRALDAPVEVGGKPVTTGRSGIVGRASVAPLGDRLVDTVPSRALVRGPEGTRFDGADVAVGAPAPDGGAVPTTVVFPAGGIQAGNVAGAVYGYELPDRIGDRPVDQTRLRLHLPSLFNAGQVWVGDHWVAFPEVPAGGAEVDLPDGAVVQGQVFVRMLIPIDRMPPKGREMVIYEVAG